MPLKVLCRKVITQTCMQNFLVIDKVFHFTFAFKVLIRILRCMSLLSEYATSFVVNKRIYNVVLFYFRLESREITYTEGTKAEPKRQIKDIIDTFSRNYSLPAKSDIWKKIFHMQENTIDLLYHYAHNFVTNDTRNYIKPNLAETGGKILFYPDKTSGYIVSTIQIVSDICCLS